jgi:hypothetical protein
VGPSWHVLIPRNRTLAPIGHGGFSGLSSQEAGRGLSLLRAIVPGRAFPKMGPVGEGVPLRNPSFTGGGKDPTIGSILSLSAIVGHQIGGGGERRELRSPGPAATGGVH